MMSMNDLMLVTRLQDAINALAPFGQGSFSNDGNVFLAEWHYGSLTVSAEAESGVAEVMAKNSKTNRIGFARWSETSAMLHPNLLWAMGLSDRLADMRWPEVKAHTDYEQRIRHQR